MTARRCEADDGHKHHAEERDSSECAWFFEQDNAQDCCSNGADPHPDAIRGADGERFRCESESTHAGHQTGDGEDCRQWAGEALRGLKPNRPASFQNACGDEQDPCHHTTPPIVAPSGHNRVRRFSRPGALRAETGA